MAVCAYLENTESTEISSLVSGKTKLAPKKRALTTPKLELLAILLAFRLAQSVATVISNIRKINIASDSLIALSWVRSTRKLPLFVINQRNRIRTIMNTLTELGTHCNLYHVPGERNPADAGTRGVTSTQLRDIDWIKGPQWLLDKNGRSLLVNIESIQSWNFEVDEEDNEKVALAELQSQPEYTPSPVIDLSRYSDFNKALRVTAYVGKFVNKLRENDVEQQTTQIHCSTSQNFLHQTK